MLVPQAMCGLHPGGGGKITEDTVLTPITIQLRLKDMTFKNENDVQRARANIFGRVSTIIGRVVQVFEDVVFTDH